MGLIPRAADSTEPATVPEAFAVRPNGVIPYVDGQYAWTPDQVARFPRYEAISATGDPASMRVARWVDVERFDATPDDVPLCWESRKSFHFTDFGVYCDRSTIGDVLDATESREPLWWIATLDNHPWTPAALAADVYKQFGVTITPARVRWIQCFPMGTYDVSRGFGRETWTQNRVRPQERASNDH